MVETLNVVFNCLLNPLTFFVGGFVPSPLTVQAVVLSHGSGEDPLRDQSSADRRRAEDATRGQQHQVVQEQQEQQHQQQRPGLVGTDEGRGSLRQRQRWSETDDAKASEGNCCCCTTHIDVLV